MARCHQLSPPPNHIPPLILMAYSQGPLGDVGVGGVSEGRKIKLIWLSNFFRLVLWRLRMGWGWGGRLGGTAPLVILVATTMQVRIHISNTSI